MKREHDQHKRQIRLGILACLLVFLAGCGPQSRTAIYQIDGPAGSAALVRYRVPGGAEQQESVTLPWSRQVNFTNGQQLEVVADNTTRAGNITCSIVIEGQADPVVRAEDIDQAACRATP
ncbi:MAG: hypothetical protein Fur005_32330 [Roseiflexaceae bacterium]